MDWNGIDANNKLGYTKILLLCHTHQIYDWYYNFDTLG